MEKGDASVFLESRMLKKQKRPLFPLKLRRALKFSLSYKEKILALFFLGLLSSGFGLLTPLISRLFIDKAFIGRDISEFLRLSVFSAVIFAVTVLFKVITDIARNKAVIKLRFDLSRKFIRKFYSLDMDFFQSKSAGENVYRLSDTESIVSFIIENCPNILVDTARLFVILGVSLWLNARLTIVLLILSPLFLIHSVYIQNKLKPVYEHIWKNSASLSREVYEAFLRILFIKAFGLESYKRRGYLRALIKNIRLGLNSFRWGIVNTLASSFFSKAVYGAVTLYGGWMIIKGELSLGSYTAVMIYLTQLGGILESLRSRFEYFMREGVSLGRFFEIMDSRPRIADSPNAVSISRIKGEIEFKDVWFWYQKDRVVLSGIDFTMPASSWVGIAGPSGYGKTTLISLILRLYEPSRGRIFLDRLDLNNIMLGSLRQRASIATQQPFLFDVSIRENIGYGLKNISDKDIAQAARAACAEDFINSLPRGYDSVVGEDACRLSQGQKQRIAIARAIARRPDLLIFDEAASSVDFFTEEKILKKLREQRKGLSTIVISHRLSSIKDADRIYFLKQNGLIEQGTHDELMSTSQSYKDFFRNQVLEGEETPVAAPIANSP